MFRLYPVLRVSEMYDSNSYLSPDDEQYDFITTITPALQAYLPMGRLSAQVEGEASLVDYLENTQEDNATYKVAAALGGQFPGGLEFKVSDSFLHGYFKEMTEFDVAEYYDINRLVLQAAYRAQDNAKLEVQYFNYLFRYDVSDDLDRVEHTITATGYLKASSKVAALLEGSYADLRYSYYPWDAKDNWSWQVRGGATWAVTGKSTGELRVGYQYKTYESDVTADQGFITAVLASSTAFSTRTALRLELQRQTVESDYDFNPYYLTTRLSGDLEHKFSRRFAGIVGVNVRRDQYPNETTEGEQTARRRDDLFGCRLGLRYQAQRYLQADLSYNVENRASNLDVFDYFVQQVELSVRLSF